MRLCGSCLFFRFPNGGLWSGRVWALREPHPIRPEGMTFYKVEKSTNPDVPSFLFLFSSLVMLLRLAVATIIMWQCTLCSLSVANPWKRSGQPCSCEENWFHGVNPSLAAHSGKCMPTREMSPRGVVLYAAECSFKISLQGFWKVGSPDVHARMINRAEVAYKHIHVQRGLEPISS